MADLTKMSKEELVTAILGPDVELQGEFAKTHRAELLRRLGAAPSEGMKPELPTVEQLAQRMAYQHPDMGPEERQRQWEKIPVDNPWRKQWLDTANLVLEFIQSALSPARSGEPPTADVPDLYRLAYIPGMWRCPKCEFVLCKSTLSMSVGAMGTTEADRQSEECPNDGTWMVPVTYKESCATLTERFEKLITKPSTPQANAEQYIGSDQERVFLEKKALGDFAAPQPVSGDAPKVEEWCTNLEKKYGCCCGDMLNISAADLADELRPYFPPASQTQGLIGLNEKQLEVISKWAADSPHDIWGSSEVRDFNLRTFARAILSVAIPASTARNTKDKNDN